MPVEINKDTAYILVNGPSIADFADHIENCKDDDVYWCGINRYKHIEDHILSQIDKKFDILYCGSWSRFREFVETAKDFNGILITNSGSFVKARIKYDKIMISDWGFGYNSLVSLILTLAIKGVKKFFIFGADGGGKADNIYYAQDKLEDDFNYHVHSIARDTGVMNRSFWRLCDDFMIPEIKVFNVTYESSLECFNKLTYYDFIMEKKCLLA